MNHCQFIEAYHTEPGENGDPIFCDKPASIKWDGSWLCAEHYDLCVEGAKKHWGAAVENEASHVKPD